MLPPEELAKTQRPIRFSPLSWLFVSWMDPLLWRGYKHPLQPEDLFGMRDSDRADTLSSVLDSFRDELKIYHAAETARATHCKAGVSTSGNAKHEPSVTSGKLTRRPPSLLSALSKRFGFTWLISGILYALSIAAQLAVPTFIQQVIYYLQSDTDPFAKSQLFMPNGLSIAFTIFGLQILSTLFGRSYEQIVRTVTINARTALMGAIYEKSLILSGEARQTFSKGRILNLINVDVQSLTEISQQLHNVWATPLQVVITIVLLRNLIGNAMFFSFVVLGVSAAIQGGTLTPLYSVDQKYRAASDSRLKAIREMLYAIRSIKLHAWEPFFYNRVTGFRNAQMAMLKIISIIFCLFIALGQVTPSLMPVVGLIVWVKQYAPGQILDPAVVFPALSLYTILAGPLFQLPQLGLIVVETSVSFKRIQSFLLATEIEPLRTDKLEPTDDEGAAISFHNASFKWDAELKDGTDEGSKEGKRNSGPGEKNSDSNSRASDDKSKTPGKTRSRRKYDAKAEEEIDLSSTELEPFFRNLSLTIPAGKLTCIVGPVGAGKSSLLSAIIGEMTVVAPTNSSAGSLSGSAVPPVSPVTIKGRIAYAPQQPWILTETVDGNISFSGGSAGRDPLQQEEWMKFVIGAAMLEADLETLPAGRKTLVGEKGVNLSGGQQARVALARAIYQDADIYLLDDPISALDAHVGAAVFERCIKSALSSKTVVLVTHQLHLLPYADLVVVLDKGTVAQKGKFKDLIQDDAGALAGMMRGYTVGEHGETDKTRRASHRTTASSTADPAVDGATEYVAENDFTVGERNEPMTQMPAVTAGQDHDIIEEEDRVTGRVERKVWIHFFKAAGGWIVLVPILIFAAVQQGATVMGSQWLSWWAQDRFKLELNGYIRIYGALGGVQASSVFVWTGLLIGGLFAASVYYHNAALTRLMTAPMSFFESQPIGRILNRFSRDIESVDMMIWDLFYIVISTGATLISSLALIVGNVPILLALIVPLLCVYYFIMVFYRASRTELKRLDSTQRSPLYAHISETLAGLSSIRAFQAENRFISRQRLLTDLSNSPNYLYAFSPIWVSIRIELLSALITLAISLLGVTGKVDSASIGLTLTYALGVIESVGLLIRMFAQLEAEMNSIERLEHYCTEIPNEAATTLPTDPDLTWPSSGAVTISNLEVRYPSRPDHAVLKDFSIEVRPGEKIGVVGRTGSGKSTLLTVLFRLVEPTAGTILIDGVNILEIGLTTLRSRLQIITQEPTLLTGTIRSNLDVDSKHTDAEVWEVLALVGMKEYVAGLPEKLDGPVTESGANLSVGQRQLLCLGRAIIHKSKLLFLDEATASVDQAADLLIQESLRTHFADATVISIAHRLNTIAAFDRVLVLNHGAIVEFDTPAALLEKPPGEGAVFRGLAEATGTRNFAALKEAARASMAKP
ncbi:P-loop containing nucleoside triphosphate hydrolase protein [Zopfochytrium polystomum]|nr:P-loop containing nucleoside triphosphate hydrolase protein [Zopfochytrium polystomum]